MSKFSTTSCGFCELNLPSVNSALKNKPTLHFPRTKGALDDDIWSSDFARVRIRATLGERFSQKLTNKFVLLLAGSTGLLERRTQIPVSFKKIAREVPQISQNFAPLKPVTFLFISPLLVDGSS